MEHYLLEDGNEEVKEQYVGKQQVNTQHDDGQPFREDWHIIVIQDWTLGLQRICAINTATVHGKLCVWSQRQKIRHQCGILQIHREQHFPHILQRSILQIFSPLSVYCYCGEALRGHDRPLPGLDHLSIPPTLGLRTEALGLF